MELFVELAPKQPNGKTRTHKVDLKDITAFKKYARGQVNLEGHNRPSWAIVKTTKDASTESNDLFFVGVQNDGYKDYLIEHVYDKSFIEFKPKQIAQPNIV